MACKHVCDCPFEPGDIIQYKLDPNSRFPTTRTNSGLKLTLMYIGTHYAIYKWEAISTKDGTVIDSGEECMLREDFDRKIELKP